MRLYLIQTNLSLFDCSAVAAPSESDTQPYKMFSFETREHIT